MKLKSFKTHINEMVTTIDGVDFDMGPHFFDRLKERGQISKDQLNDIFHKVRAKLASLPEKGEFLFFSKKLQQGIVTAWDAFKSKLKLITFLPPKKEFAKPGTEKVVIESIGKEVTIIYID